MAEKSSVDKHSVLFMGLVTSFQQSALTALGKLVNPLTGKTEVDLQMASAHIDMLDMLAAKTKGNLSDEEAGTLEQIISHLKLNYVEEVNKPRGEKPDEPESEKSGKEQSSTTTSSESEKDEKTESDEEKGS
jgi:hypothetical protein